MNLAIRVIAVVLAVATIPSVAHAKVLTLDEFLTSQGYTAIPIRRGKQNHLFVNGKVNGRKAVMLVDTGAQALFIDPNKAKGMKEVEKFPEKIQGLFGTVTTLGAIVMIDKLEIGSASFEEEPAVLAHVRSQKEIPVNEATRIPTAASDESLVVGWEFLSRHHAIIDNSAPMLFLRETEPPADFANAFGRSMLASGYTLVPLVSRDFLIEVSVTVNGHPALFQIDSGGPHTVIDGKQAADLGADIREQVGELVDAGKHRRGLHFTRLRSLQIGNDFTAEKILVGVIDLQPLNKNRVHNDMPPVQGLLGPDLLNWGQAVIDCAGLRLYLSPTTKK